MPIEEPIERRREPCDHPELIWTSLDSAYCPGCGQELCAEVSDTLAQLAVVAPYGATA